MKDRFRLGPSPLDRATENTTVADVWHLLGLPGHPGKSCRSPFRQDRQPSFSVFDSGRRWKDHATGEGGDVLDFIARELNCGLSEASTWLLNSAGTQPARRARPRFPFSVAKPKPSLPAIDAGTYADVRRLQVLRALPLNIGIEILIRRGVLGFANLNDGQESIRCWVITDAAQRNAQAQRIDGKPWQFLPGEPKAKTLPGSAAAWPLGAGSIGERDTILFCEGGPDLLAAATVAFLEGEADRCGFACMTGASMRIHPEALEFFTGKRIRILGHADEAGRNAAAIWYHELRATGAEVDCWKSDCEGEDLNDYLSRSAPNGPAERITPKRNPRKPSGGINQI